MKLKNLEMALQRCEGYTRPRAALEQYQTPAPLAARLLFDALMSGDIEGKRICDPGCGTGVLAIGAALLGAESVTGIEIDEGALKTARANATLLGADVEFIPGDVKDALLPQRVGACNTVIMNPPFGAQNVHADRPFIDFALNVAGVTYGIFNAGSIPFVAAYTAQRAEITAKTGGKFLIKRTFAFHTRDSHEIEVEILRLKRIP
jgi:putative methylase